MRDWPAITFVLALAAWVTVLCVRWYRAELRKEKGDG